MREQNALDRYNQLVGKANRAQGDLDRAAGRIEQLDQQLSAAGFETAEDAQSFVDKSYKQIKDLDSKIQVKLRKAEGLVKEVEDVLYP